MADRCDSRGAESQHTAAACKTSTTTAAATSSSSATDTEAPKLSGGPLFILTVLSCVPPLTMEIYLPSLPGLTISLRTTATLALLSISAYQFSFALSQVALGPLSDVHGRRGLLLGGLVILVTTCAAAAAAPTIEALMVVRVLQGCGSSSCVVLFQAMLRDTLPPGARERAMSRIAVVRQVSPLVAPVLGSFLQAAFGWRSTFAFLAIFTAALLASAYAVLPETLAPSRRQRRCSMRSVCGGYASLLRRRDFLMYAAPEALGFAGTFCWIATSSFLLQGFYHLPVAWFGPIYCLSFAGSISGSSASPLLRRRLGVSPRRLYMLASAAAVGPVAVLALLSLTPLMAVPSILSQALLQINLVLYMFARAVCAVQAQVQVLEPFPTRAATAAGLMGFMRSASVCVVSASSSALLREGTPRLLCRAVCALAATSAAAHYTLRTRKAARPPLRVQSGGSSGDDGLGATGSDRGAAAGATGGRMLSSGGGCGGGNLTDEQLQGVEDLRAAHAAVRLERTRTADAASAAQPSSAV